MSTTHGPTSQRHATSTARKPRKSRGRGLRTTTGCKICRKRHMKCDEVRPTCGPCGKSNRPCEYDEISGLPEPANDHDGHGAILAAGDRSQASSNVSPDTYPWPRQEVRPARTQDAEDSYTTETAPVRLFGLLATDTADVDLNMDSLCSTNGNPELSVSHGRPNVMQVSTIAPSTSHDEIHELSLWQAQDVLRLQGLEHDMYTYFVTTVSAWIDIFDPGQHFATEVPRLALYNEGLMKAILAVGARHLAFRAAASSCDAVVFQHAAVQYYAETLQYLQSAMRHTSYKNSQELLATTLIISAYEMLDGSGKGWERHLKGVFWIQRTREINGESGGLEQAVWWAWIHQDVWAAFRERRRCFSFFKPTRPYSKMDIWDKASRIVYILAQCVNFVSDEEKRTGEREPSKRASRAEALVELLNEWDANKGIGFNPLPPAERSDQVFKPLWIHPPAFAVSVQMFHVSRILLLSQKTTGSEKQQDVLEHQQDMSNSLDVVAGLTTQLANDPSRAYSTQYLSMAGLFCSDEQRQKGILDIVEESAARSDWPWAMDLSSELRAAWSRR